MTLLPESTKQNSLISLLLGRGKRCSHTNVLTLFIAGVTFNWRSWVCWRSWQQNKKGTQLTAGIELAGGTGRAHCNFGIFFHPLPRLALFYGIKQGQDPPTLNRCQGHQPPPARLLPSGFSLQPCREREGEGERNGKGEGEGEENRKGEGEEKGKAGYFTNIQLSFSSGFFLLSLACAWVAVVKRLIQMNFNQF